MANRAKAEAALAQYRAQLVEAEASLVEAQRQSERSTRLEATGSVSASQKEQATTALASATARVETARQAITVAEADIKVVDSQIADTDLRLARTEVKSPVAGTISVRNARIGAIASAPDSRFSPSSVTARSNWWQMCRKMISCGSRRARRRPLRWPEALNRSRAPSASCHRLSIRLPALDQCISRWTMTRPPAPACMAVRQLSSARPRVWPCHSPRSTPKTARRRCEGLRRHRPDGRDQDGHSGRCLHPGHRRPELKGTRWLPRRASSFATATGSIPWKKPAAFPTERRRRHEFLCMVHTQSDCADPGLFPVARGRHPVV